MGFLKRVNYLGSFTTLFILTGISFAVLLLFILYIEFLDFQYKSDIDKAKHETRLKQEKIHNFYSRYEKFLLTVEHNRFFITFLENPTKKNKEDLITLFATLSDEEFMMLSEKIKSTLSYMSQTIDNFRDFFKPKKGKNKFNIVQVAQDAYNILEMKLKKSDILYEVMLAPNLSVDELVLDSYEGEFKQVLVSIINNAIEAIDLQSEQKRYFIKTLIKQNEDKYIISIEDNAGGIKSEILENIFEPYLSTKFEQNGTGLGLYMSKMIIENSIHGKLTAHNTQQGACFIIEIEK